ncbi:MAG: hypothetical protein NVSMB69_15890 [Novosphingobium sp.]
MAAPSPHVLGIEPKMYRHFAALTVVISLSIAFVANGGQSPTLPDSLTSTPVKQQKKGNAPRSEMDVLNGKPEDPSPVRSGGPPPPPPPSIGEGPIDPVPADDGQFYARRSDFSYRRPLPKVDPALLAKMTPAQRAAYLSVLAQQGMSPMGGPPGGLGGPTQSQMDRLVSASRARSGASD